MKKYQNPFKNLSKEELIIWLCSLSVIALCFLLNSSKDYLTLITCLIGATALIFVAKGDPLGQILTVVFAIFYSVISFSLRYYGEMITYLCMSAPIAALSAVQWFKNPYKEGENEVKLKRVSVKEWIILIISTILVTSAFYFILRAFDTANLIMSTVSVSTSFLAAVLTFLRSPFYGLGYGANDIVLIILWVLASKEDSSYIPMVVCFTVFLINDCYGFLNWQRIKKKQENNN